MSFNKSISIIGGAGHVGFPLGLAFANKNYNVSLIDRNSINLNKIKSGQMPFYETGGKKILLKCLKKKKLFFSNNLNSLKKSKYVIICIGTPINKNLKPNTKDFYNFFKRLKKFINKKHVIIIRSSVYPGIIEKIYSKFKKVNQNLCYCPERIVQSKALIELPKLPQIISAKNDYSLKETKKLFLKICKKILITNIKEAEMCKLFSNANRYINFSIANQFYSICKTYNINFNEVRNIMTNGYERNFNLLRAGFTAGPCLLKDTMQLNSFFKNNFKIGHAAMYINEGMIDLVIKDIKKLKNFKKKSYGLLGITFKAETDDIRDSLAIKLYKKLKKMKLKVNFSDHYYKGKDNLNKKKLIKLSDVIIIGAPHNVYKKINIPKKKFLINIWI